MYAIKKYTLAVILPYYFSYLGKKFKQLNDLLCNLSGCDLFSSQYAKVFYYKVGLTKATNLKLGKKTKGDLILMREAK